jgi:hypothetical protein
MRREEGSGGGGWPRLGLCSAAMEGMLLRSLPARLPGPVDPVHAVALVERMLPGLGPGARRALALVDLGARPRAEAAEELGVAEPELSRLLAWGRKALRRRVAELPAGGWCERAERLIYDRMDGVLTPAGEARLEAHLPGCERCATHEQRLVQAHDLLVDAYLAAHPATPTVAAVPAAELRVVEPPAEAVDVTSRSAVSPRVWHMAFVLAVLLALAAVVLAVLGATGILPVP